MTKTQYDLISHSLSRYGAQDTQKVSTSAIDIHHISSNNLKSISDYLNTYGVKPKVL